MHSLALSLALFTTASAALQGAAPEFVGAHNNVPKSFIYEFADEAVSDNIMRIRQSLANSGLGVDIFLCYLGR